MEETAQGHATALAEKEPRRQEGDASMFCTACGTKNGLDANFCKQCGRKMEKAAPSLNEEEFASLQQPEDRVGDLMVVAFKRYEAGDLEGAIKACEAALLVRPESTSAHSLLGTLYERQGERDKAIAAFERVLQLNPGSIADREKLEQLRDSTTSITPRRITSSRRMPRTVLFESSGAAAAAGVGVFLLVLCVGAWAIWFRGSRASAGQKAPVVANTPLPNPILGIQQPSQQPQQIAQRNAGPWPGNPQAGYGAASEQTGASAFTPGTQPRRVGDGDGFGPAPIRIHQPDPLEVRAPNTQQPPDGGGTVHLPDNGLGGAERGPSPTGNPPANPNPIPGKPNSGTIIIELQKPPNQGGPGGTQAGGGNAGTAAVNGGGGTPTPTMESRSRRESAQQAQFRGDYRTAVREYLKALDGAGDDTAIIHQQAALCYQRLDEKDQAISQYNAAIEEYRRMLASGRGPDVVARASSGIRACEQGIKICQ